MDPQLVQVESQSPGLLPETLAKWVAERLRAKEAVLLFLFGKTQRPLNLLIMMRGREDVVSPHIYRLEKN